MSRVFADSAFFARVLVRRGKSAACKVPGCRATFRRVANWVSIESILGFIIELLSARRGKPHNAALGLRTPSLAVGVDVGGSSIKCALIDLNAGAFAGERFSTPTPAQDSTDALLHALESVVSNIPGDHAVGLAFPSVIRGGVVRSAANLNKAWIGQPLAELAGKQLRRPVIAINDGDAAGLAELHYGAARNVAGTVLLLTLGTGSGSALFFNGRLVPHTAFGAPQISRRELEQPPT